MLSTGNKRKSSGYIFILKHRLNLFASNQNKKARKSDFHFLANQFGNHQGSRYLWLRLNLRIVGTNRPLTITSNATKRPMLQNAQCCKTPKETKRSSTKRPLLHKAQNPKNTHNPKKTPKILYKRQKYTQVKLGQVRLKRLGGKVLWLGLAKGPRRPVARIFPGGGAKRPPARKKIFLGI